jgi:hypothetical protein
MAATPKGSEIIKDWPKESQEATQLVIDAYGEPREGTESLLTWHQVGPWKRVLASKVFFDHQFLAPHYDSVESVIDYRVPPEQFTPPARCHDEQANFLALNLMHDLVTGAKGVEEARACYAEEFLNARRKQPAPYMEQLRFQPGTGTPDPDQRVLSDQDLEQAQQEGEQKGSAE